MLERFERYPLMFGPMLIEKLIRLSEPLGGEVEIRETNDAIRLATRTEGVMTDPVYEGKSMPGLVDLVRKGFCPAGSKVLYAHLGGVPAINACSYVCRNG